MDILTTITELSHTFGTDRYVRGGGGNTSAKDSRTLWIKPSGTILAKLQPSDFGALDRRKIARLYDAAVPAKPDNREALVKDILMAAVKPDSKGRPSVESPLHDSLRSAFVVHTHPAMVNGFTCAANGKAAAARLFPSALWVDYVDPGYTLSMQVRKQIRQYESQFGHQPEIILLENHGIFVASDSPSRIEELYSQILSTLRVCYNDASIPLTMAPPARLSPEKLRQAAAVFQKALSPGRSAVVGVEHFDLPAGPLSPDHIVYSKSFPFLGEPTPQAIQDFTARRGYEPAVIAWQNAVFALGATPKEAELALEFALDGAQVMTFARCFGGARFLSDASRAFIENWEVENYRKSQIQ